MKRRNLLSRIALFGISIWLLCFLFITVAAAIDTPWVTLQPDSETSEEPSETADTGFNQPETIGEVPTTEQSEKATEPASDKQSAADAASAASDPAAGAGKKHGCKSTVAGTAILLPALLSVLFIGSNVFQKRE